MTTTALPDDASDVAVLTLGYEPPFPELDTAAEVLGFIRGEESAIRLREARVFAAVVTFAHQHPAESLAGAAGWHEGCGGRDCGCAASSRGGETVVPVAGPGAPLVAEFAVAELAAAMGKSTNAGKAYLGHALEVHHRLPRTRSLVEAGLLPVWRARRIAEHTTSLCEDGAAYIDEQVAPFADRVGPVTLERLVTDALARFEPERAAEQAAAAAEQRHVRTGPLARPGAGSPGADLSGMSFLDAVLDGSDADDFEIAVQLTAARLAEQQMVAGQEPAPLEVRRAKALGIIGRDQVARHGEDEEHEQAERGEQAADREQPPSRSPRQKVLHLHLSVAALRRCACTGTLLARIEEGDHKVVLADVVREWLGAALQRGEQITVKPVTDLADHQHVSAYEAPDRLSEQTALINPTCVFPWCTRAARLCDDEHPVPFDKGGPTCSCNQAPLCRRHHRLKTHASWSYVPLDPGAFVWTSPHGYQYLVDGGGTLDVTPDRRRGRPLPPHDRAAET